MYNIISNMNIYFYIIILLYLNKAVFLSSLLFYNSLRLKLIGNILKFVSNSKLMYWFYRDNILIRKSFVSFHERNLSFKNIYKKKPAYSCVLLIEQSPSPLFLAPSGGYNPAASYHNPFLTLWCKSNLNVT